MESISVRYHVSMKDLESLIYSMATGARYWSDSSILGFESTFKKLKDGQVVKFQNFEHDEEYPKWCNLDMVKLKKGLTVMGKKYPEHFADIVEDNADEITSDVLLQCALFGEVVYG